MIDSSGPYIVLPAAHREEHDISYSWCGAWRLCVILQASTSGSTNLRRVFEWIIQDVGVQDADVPVRTAVVITKLPVDLF